MTDALPAPQTTFERGLAVMVAIALNGDITVEDLAKDLAMPVSSLYRFIKSLRKLSLIEERQGSYVPGWRLLELSGQHLTHTRLAEIGASVLSGIVEGTSETAVLTVRSGLHAICLRQVESPHALRYAFKINELLPLHAGAGQRTLLAYSPPAVIEKVLSQGLHRFTDRTLTRDRLSQHLAQIRRAGLAVSHGELSAGALAISVPVFGAGEIVCSLTVAGPEIRCSSNAWATQARGALNYAASLLSDAVEEP